MTTGTKLKLLRENKTLSQEELAHAVGVTQTTIGNWEHGKSIKHDYISKLAEAFEVSADYLMRDNLNVIAIPIKMGEDLNNGFEFILKAPNNFFEDLNRKMDFLISRFDEMK